MNRDALFSAADVAYDNGDYPTALSLFQQAAEAGDSDAMSRLATMYEGGEGVERDIEQSISWDMKAIAAGNRTSLLNLGITYRRLGDIKSAKMWFEKSHAQGDAEAALELAKLYSVSDKEVETVRRYLTEVVSSEYVTQDSIDEAQTLLRELPAA